MSFRLAEYRVFVIYKIHTMLLQLLRAQRDLPALAQQLSSSVDIPGPLTALLYTAKVKRQTIRMSLVIEGGFPNMVILLPAEAGQSLRGPTSGPPEDEVRPGEP